jgi:hypothetical protein
MNASAKRWMLVLLTFIAAGSVFLLPPIAQSLTYHDFADKRTVLGISNFANVISNFPFLLVGLAGLRSVERSTVPKSLGTIYIVLFLGIFLTGFGSAYYHYNPDNNTLVYDRIPLSIVFMALLSATVAELIDYKTGVVLWVPLVLLGVASVWWWHYGEERGHGDLRLYGLVQFYPMVFIPLILWLFYDPAYKSALRPLAWVVLWYGVAKVCELLDKSIYSVTGVISGHTLKHLAAAMSTWYLVVMFRRKYEKHGP